MPLFSDEGVQWWVLLMAVGVAYLCAGAARQAAVLLLCGDRLRVWDEASQSWVHPRRDPTHSSTHLANPNAGQTH